MAESFPENVVVVGAGIIGVATAYHLSLLSPKTTIHLLEASPTLFASASGKAAGFLARDWFTPSTASLGALSFDLHKQLAAEHDGARLWGYHPSAAFSISDVQTSADGARGEDWLFEGTSRGVMAGTEGGGESALPPWLAVGRGQASAHVEPLSSGATTAQVDPLLLCQFLLEQSQSRGVHLHHPANPNHSVFNAENQLVGITIRASDGTESTLPCDTLLLTAGVWTPRVFHTLFPNSTSSLPVTQLSGHSLVLRSPHLTADAGAGCHAAFTTDADAGFAPEIFSRAGGEIYLAGLNSTAIPVAERAADVQPDEACVEALVRVARRLLGEEELDVVRTALCHRPVTRKGTPLVGRVAREVTGTEGNVWVSAGHGPWGISMSLGTGLVLAELVLGKKPSADVSRLAL